jgi:hypothetical protein
MRPGGNGPMRQWGNDELAPTPFQPLSMVLFSAALVLQSVAVLIQRRSMVLFCGLLAVSMFLVWQSFTVAL